MSAVRMTFQNRIANSNSALKVSLSVSLSLQHFHFVCGSFLEASQIPQTIVSEDASQTAQKQRFQGSELRTISKFADLTCFSHDLHQ